MLPRLKRLMVIRTKIDGNIENIITRDEPSCLVKGRLYKLHKMFSQLNNSMLTNDVMYDITYNVQGELLCQKIFLISSSYA